MPKQETKSSVLKSLKGKVATAIKKHKDDPVDYGNMRIPAGIVNGVARLTTAEFATYKKGDNVGKPYCRLAGVVVEPKTIIDAKGNVVPVEGCQTSIMIPLCDTKNGKGEVVSFESHIADVMNEFKKLDADISWSDDPDEDELESTAAELAEKGPYFRLSTSVRAAMERYNKVTKKKEMSEEGVWENWYGGKGLEDYAPDAAQTEEDDTKEEPEDPEEVVEQEETPKPAKTKAAPAKGKPPARPPIKGKAKVEEPEEPEFDPKSSDDLDLLLAWFNDDKDGDGLAQDRLKEIAKEAGVPDDVIEGEGTYEDLVAAIRSAQEGGSEEEEEAEEEAEEEEVVEPWKPAKGEVCSYNGKEYSIEAIDAKKKTAKLKNVESGKFASDVPLAKLSEPSAE